MFALHDVLMSRAVDEQSEKVFSPAAKKAMPA
jgi:hypothetical protein